jgi:two-component system CheB/CheR fusion protein
MYRSATLTRRVERRMAIHRCVTIRQYNKFLQDNQQESDFLFKEILIGVTSFFRDPMVWDYFSNKILPTLMDDRQAGHTFRIWCAGCSTGEEAYTIGMIFSEIIEKHPDKRFGLKIFGTDVSDDAITAARLGVYTKKSCSNINEKRLEYFFDDYEDSFKVNQNLRKNILFAVHDVTKDPPFTKLDMIFCRNLLIYFDPILQKKLIPKFHHCLLPAGYLLLGSAETIGDCSHLFTDIHAEFRCYQHIDAKQIYSPVQSKIPLLPVYHRGSEPLADIGNSDPLSSNRLQLAADHILLQVFAPAAVVVNTEADIVYISGHTGTYLEPAAGKANWNFLAMAREGIRQPIALALKRLSGRRAPLHIRNLFMQSGTSRINVKVTLQKLYDPAVLRGMTMIVFEHTHTKTKSSTSKKSLLNPDLTQTQHNQQSMEEIQSLREEVHSSNLDLINSKKSMQSANEQLQSANEELMTSKEEMQSMNEELQTINSELQSKLDDLELAKSDMQNVLNSVDIAILFLDKQLNIRRFTDRAQDIIQLRDSDLGRPLSDLNSSLRYPQLHIDAASTLSSLVESEKEIFTTDQRCYLVRIIPYHRLDNVIDGVVITLQDITANKKDEIHENQINCDH